MSRLGVRYQTGKFLRLTRSLFQVRNLSDWIDAKPYMKVMVNEIQATDGEIEEIEGLNQGLSLRICLLPMGPDSFTLQVKGATKNKKGNSKS